jgi:hypothetical protein
MSRSGQNLLLLLPGGGGVSGGGGSGSGGDDLSNYLFLARFGINRAAPLGTPFACDVGSLVVVDTENKLSVSGGSLVCAGGKAAPAQGDPGVWSDAVARAPGRVMLATITPANTSNTVRVGWDTNQSGALGGNCLLTASGGAGGLGVSESAGAGILVGTFAAAQIQVAVVMRAVGAFYFVKSALYPQWTLVWVGATNSTSPLYANLGNYSLAFSADTFAVPRATWLPVPLLSDSFNRADGAIGSSDGAGHAEANGGNGVAWPSGATWTIDTNRAKNTPVAGADLLAALNPGFETAGAGSPDVFGTWTEDATATSSIADDAADFHGGAHSAKMTVDATNHFAQIAQALLTVGVWYRLSCWAKGTGGDFEFGNGASGPPDGLIIAPTAAWAQYAGTMRAANTTLQFKRSNSAGFVYNFDDVTAQALVLAELLNVPLFGTSAVKVCTVPTYVAGYQDGSAACWDSQTNPQNGMIAYFDGNGRIHLDKCVGGTWAPSLLSVTTAAVAGKTLEIDTWLSDADTMQVRVFYNNAAVGTVQTLTRAGGDGAIIDAKRHGGFSTDPAVFLDNAMVWAKGQSGEYAALGAL